MTDILDMEDDKFNAKIRDSLQEALEKSDLIDLIKTTLKKQGLSDEAIKYTVIDIDLVMYEGLKVSVNVDEDQVFMDMVKKKVD